MFAYLKGKIIERDFTRIVLDVQGVGYEVFIPMSTYDYLPLENEEIALKILTNVREDAITLYGFHTTGEKNLFILLNSVSGIGPKLALNILSALPVSQICFLIAECNITALAKINGVGKKTAERLSVELREKVGSILISQQSGNVKHCENSLQKNSVSPDVEDAISALQTLGFKDLTARKTVMSLIEELDVVEHNAENLIRKALKKMNS